MAPFDSYRMRPFENTSIGDLPGEVWVDAIDLDGYYEVSNLGRIKSLGRWVNTTGGQRWKKEIIRKQFLNKNGSLCCRLNLHGRPIDLNLPALFYFSFNPDESKNSRKDVIMHQNKIKWDNRLENLILTSCSKSHARGYKLGVNGKQLVAGQKKHSCYTESTAKFDAKGRTTHRACRRCKDTLPQSSFESYGMNICQNCRNKRAREIYRAKKNGVAPGPP